MKKSAATSITLLAILILAVCHLTAAAETTEDSYYPLLYMTGGDENITAEMLDEYGLEVYLVLKADGTGYLVSYGDLREFTWQDGELDLMGNTLPFTEDGDTISLQDEDLTMVFQKSPDPVPEKPDPAAYGGEEDEDEYETKTVTPQMIAGYEGDWIGTLELTGESETFSGWNGNTCDLAARFSFPEDGSITVFLRAAFPEETDLSMNFTDIEAQLDPWFEEIFISGKLLGCPFTEMTDLGRHLGDTDLFAFMTITAENGDTANARLEMRRLGETWTGEEYPPFAPDRAESFKELSMEQVLAEMGIPADGLPEKTHAGDAILPETDSEEADA